jgi:hypothetical protein
MHRCMIAYSLIAASQGWIPERVPCAALHRRVLDRTDTNP